MKIQQLLSLFILAWLTTACDTVSDKLVSKQQTITGSIMYEEQVAMPPGAFIQVVLQDMTDPGATSSLIADQLIKPAHSVPIPFKLEFDSGQIKPEHSYAILAEIRTSGGELLWMTMAPQIVDLNDSTNGLQVMLGATELIAAQSPRKTTGSPRTLYYECSEQGFLVKTNGEDATVFLRTRSATLKQVPAASGVKYEGNGISFWSKGQEATIVIGKTVHKGCRSNPAKAPWVDAKNRGIDFRGVGNEPGWHLEIDTKQSMHFVYDYGQKETTTPVPRAESSGNRTTYHAQTGASDLKVLIDSYPCQDSMSGESFSSKVQVELNGQVYSGCGRWL